MDTTFSVPFLPQVGALDEAGWLDAARAGEPWALEQLYQRHQGAVYALCHRLLGRTEDARDAAQTTFMRAFRQLPNFRGHSSLKTWLYRIAVNESLDLLRRSRREAPLDDEIDIPDLDGRGPEALLSETQMNARIRRSVMSMSVNDRVVLTLRHFSDCSYEQIAEILDLDEKTVKSRLFDARRRLRGLLGDLG